MNETLYDIESAKQALLENAENEAEYRSVLSRLNAKQLKEIQKEYWSFLIEESRTAKTPISRSDILSRLEPTAKYQQRARCKEPEGYCTISMCVRINPQCAVTRISEIMLAIRPLVIHLLKERPELRDYFKHRPAAPAFDTAAPTQDELVTNSFALAEAEIRPRPERTPEIIPDEVRQKFQKYRELLGKMLENEGLEHAILMSKGGTILVYASSKPNELTRLSSIISDEIHAVTEQGEAANLIGLLTVTKEYTDGVVAIRSIGQNLYLVGVSRIVLPARIHSLIIRLGTELSKEVSNFNQFSS